MARPAPADPVEAIARAVLYEGYLLWPYRRSAPKNRTRFNFGVLYPRGFCAALDQHDESTLRCECLIEGDGAARVSVELRCLRLVHRQVVREQGDRRQAFDSIGIAGETHLTWDEAREFRHPVPAASLDDLAAATRRVEVRSPGGCEREALGPCGAGQSAAFERTWEELEAAIQISAEPIGDCARDQTPPLWRLRADVENPTLWSGYDRLEAQRHALLQAHLVLRIEEPAGRGDAAASTGRDALHAGEAANGADSARFVSLADPPARALDAANACRNRGVWPVLVGGPGDRSSMLAAPIVLEDYPRVAPESDGDLFDGAEIVELLGLSILALTDDEKREMAATDPEARAILERVGALDRASLDRLHGVLTAGGIRK